jgi:hypothetical protein
MPARATLIRAAVLAAAVASWPARAAAQQSVSDILSVLVVTPPAVQTGDPSLDRAAAQATRDTLSRSLLAALANLPLTSSSSGFTYRFNPGLGTLERTTGGFGPFFVERAATAGAGHAAMAVSFQYARFDQLDGMNLRDGTLVTTSNRFTDESKPFDVETLRLEVRAATVTLSGSYGLTDRLDVGAALPFVSLSVDGARTDTYRGATFQQITASASSVRLGDLLGRAKLVIARGAWGGFSLGGDVRLPTGSESDLVGAGRAGERLFVVASAGTGAVSTHVNAGVSRGGVSGGFDYGAAVAASPTPRVTIVGEAFGRRLSDIDRIVSAVAPHPTIVGVQTLRLVEGGTITNTLLGSLGIKWNIADEWLLSAHVLLPLSDAGLTARLIPWVSLEYNLR